MTHAKSPLVLLLLVLFPVIVAANSFTTPGEPSDEVPTEKVSTIDIEIEAMHPALLNLINKIETHQGDNSRCNNMSCTINKKCDYWPDSHCLVVSPGLCVDGSCGDDAGGGPIRNPSY